MSSTGTGSNKRVQFSSAVDDMVSLPTMSASSDDDDDSSRDDDNALPRPIASEPIQIVTWYMADALSFGTLVRLLTTNRLYETTVRKLEVVAPTDQVSDATLEELLDWMEFSPSLQEIVVFLVEEQTPRALELLERIELVAHDHLRYGATIKTLEKEGSPVDLLCDSLSPLETSAMCRRHLAMDGSLFPEIMSTQDIRQLAFDISWDRSIHVLLLKDLSTPCLSAILPKLVYGPLHTLKIVHDPAHDNTRQLPNAKQIPTNLVKDMLTSSRLKTLRRLYLGHVQLDVANTPALLEGCLASHTLIQLELCLCQFESGTGRLFQHLVEQTEKGGSSSLKQVLFYYPIIGGGDNTKQPSK